jgi:DNA polymerase III epsilon subunit-like protein
MYYISLDLEWNQAYAEQALAVQKRLASRLRGEVIQIGAVKLDENLAICGSYSVIVRPKYFRRIHRHVMRLTGISQEMIDRGMPLPEAAESFRRWCGEDFAFLTWGPDDIPMLEDNLRIHHVDYSWLCRVYDLQKIYNRQTDGLSKQRSLEYVMEQFEIPQNLPAHDALNDAYFTALVAQKLDIARGVAEYSLMQGSSDTLLSDIHGDADAGQKGYDTPSAILADTDIVLPACPSCGKRLSPMDRIVHSKGQRYTQILTCEEHGSLLLDLRLVRNFNETWRVRRSISVATAEAVEKYKTKLAESAAGRRPRRPRRRPRRPIGEGGAADSASEKAPASVGAPEE